MSSRALILLCFCFLASGEYDPDAAALLLGFAQASYCPDLKNWECGAVCRDLPKLMNVTVVEDKNTDGKAYVGFEPNSLTIIISFRGTVATSFENWWSDLSSLKLVDSPYCPAANCQIGDGFSTAYMALREDLRDALYALQREHPESKVHVTGHSLGAALAHVCTSDLKNDGTDPDAVITFGSPRTGNDEFVKYCSDTNRTRWRLTHHRDPIVHLPPMVAFSQFVHAPVEVFYMDSTGLAHRVCDGSGEDENCSAGMIPLPTTTDHLHYLDRRLGSHGCPA